MSDARAGDSAVPRQRTVEPRKTSASLLCEAISPPLRGRVVLDVSSSNESNLDGHRLRPRESPDLEQKIAQASRLAFRITDETTVGRLAGLIEELSGKLKKLRSDRRSQDEIRARARMLWEQNGRPDGRDLEIWLQAESEIHNGT
jgi:hypothetical protein